MIRRWINFVLDATLLLAALLLVETGLIVRFALPPGTGGRHGGAGLLLLGWNRHDWGDLHFWVAVTAIGLLLVHLALHWRWVSTMVAGLVARWRSGGAGVSKRASLASGVTFAAFVAAVLGGAFWLGLANVEEVRAESPRATGDVVVVSPADDHGLRGHTADEDASRLHWIRGQLTLADVCTRAGLSPVRLCEALKLPGTTPTEERLGRLGRRYGFSMDQVRRTVAELTATASPS